MNKETRKGYNSIGSFGLRRCIHCQEVEISLFGSMTIYKKTKLGWIPKDWAIKKLGEIRYKIGDEHVILHELLHIKQPNHGKEFYRLLDLVLPDWKKRKERLEQENIVKG